MLCILIIDSNNFYSHTPIMGLLVRRARLRQLYEQTPLFGWLFLRVCSVSPWCQDHGKTLRKLHFDVGPKFYKTITRHRIKNILGSAAYYRGHQNMRLETTWYTGCE